MKAKRHVDCLETCRQVLEANPKYEPIKADIQSKVMEVIRWFNWFVKKNEILKWILKMNFFFLNV